MRFAMLSGFTPSAFPAMRRSSSPAEQVWNDFKGHTANSLLRNKQDIRLNLHARPPCASLR